MIKRKVNNREDAEEITQDVFIKVFDGLKTYDKSKSAFKTWIWNIAKHAVIDYWRATKNRCLIQNIEGFVDEDGSEIFVHTDNNNPHMELTNNELKSKIVAEINLLGSPYQKIAELSLLKEMSYEEIADHMELPLGTVKGTLHRAKELLRNRLLNL